MAESGRRMADGGKRTADGGRRTADGGRRKIRKIIRKIIIIKINPKKIIKINKQKIINAELMRTKAMHVVQIKYNCALILLMRDMKLRFLISGNFLLSKDINISLGLLTTAKKKPGPLNFEEITTPTISFTEAAILLVSTKESAFGHR